MCMPRWPAIAACLLVFALDAAGCGNGTPQEQPHANFAFVTPGVQVESFAVPDIEVSDHLPMLMTIIT